MHLMTDQPDYEPTEATTVAYVATETGDRVRTRRRRRRTMPAVVVPQNLDVLGERSDLLVPHVERRAERVR